MNPLSMLLLVVCACGAVLGEDYCTEADATIVMDQWTSIYNAGVSSVSRATLGNQIFAALFKLAPDTEALFSRVGVSDMSSGAFRAHASRVLSGLDMGINSLKETATLDSLTSHMAAQHIARPGVKGVHFDVMGKVLMTALPTLIEGFNPDAWGNCLRPLKSAIAKGLP